MTALIRYKFQRWKELNPNRIAAKILINVTTVPSRIHSRSQILFLIVVVVATSLCSYKRLINA